MPGEQARSSQGHVLLVDDDTDFRESVAGLLRTDGWRVTEAAHGEQALGALETEPGISLIILDLLMPMMDGLTFLAHKSRGSHSTLPVMIFSSSQATGLEGFADVVSVIHKLDGIDGLLAGIRRSGAPGPGPAAGPPAKTSLSKLRTSIQGFDEITGGGLPLGRTTLIMGGPGCGKTVFALQALMNGARMTKSAGLFVGFEESTHQIVANAATFGWDLRSLAKQNLFFLDTRLSSDAVKEGKLDLPGILDFLRTKALELDAKLVVFDGIDMLLGLLDDPAAERRELYRIRDWLLQTGLTGIITQKISPTGEDRRHGFLQFMVDCVIVLRHEVVEGSAFRNLRVMKYRGSGFSGDEFPITLTKDGMQLTNRGPADFETAVTEERIPSGLPRLDNMLRGGYYRGSSVLISGAPGTAKSTLCGLFAAAACERGERTLYISFDESGSQIIRNFRSVGIHLDAHASSGMLKMHLTRRHGPNIDDQFRELRDRVAAFKPRCLVIDPLSALASNLKNAASADVVQQFLDFVKGEGITAVNTSLMDGVGTDEATGNGISAIADTWIHVSYVVQDGERNRALTIVKSRGTGHSNQVRELTLSSEGVNLADVFVAQGKVLMGVARWEWEQEEQASKKRAQVATELKRRQLQVAQAEAVARLQVIQTEIEARSAEMKVLALATGSASILLATDQVVLRKMRHADDDAGADGALPS